MSDNENDTTDNTTTETETPTSSNREAKYRKQLREAEADRDDLRERMEALQRAEVERLAGAHLAKPSALWASGVALADVLDDDGYIDEAKVTQAAAAAADMLGAAPPTRAPRPDPTQGGNGGAPAASTDAWAEAFAAKE